MKFFSVLITFILFYQSSYSCDCLPSQPAQRKVISQTLTQNFMNQYTVKICEDAAMLDFLERRKLSMEEAISIFGYVSEGYFHDINSALRTPNRFSKADLKKHLGFASVIKEALLKVPLYSGKVIRYDTRFKKEFLHHQIGEVIEQKAFTSSSALPTYKWEQESPEVKIFINSKAGRSIIALTPADEAEVIFLPGTKFKIDKMKDNPGGYLEIYWTEL